jgi:hypothetical protein
LKVDTLEVDILEVDILEVDILEVDILEVDILEVDIFEVDILEVDIQTSLPENPLIHFKRKRYRQFFSRKKITFDSTIKVLYVCIACRCN